MAGNNDFRIKIGVATDDAELNSAIKKIQDKLNKEINANIGTKGAGKSGSTSQSKQASAVNAIYKQQAESIKKVAAEHSKVSSISERIKGINQQNLMIRSKLNSKGEVQSRTMQMQVSSASNLKTMYTQLSANLKEQSTIRQRLAKIANEDKIEEKQVLNAKKSQLEVDAQDYQQSIKELKAQQNITRLTHEDIALKQQSAKIAEKVNMIQAKQGDIANAKEAKQQYQEIMGLLARMDKLNKQISKAEASKSKSYAEQLRLQRGQTRQKLEQKQMDFDAFRANNQNLNLGQKVQNISSKRMQNEKNILMYKHQALATLKSTKGVFSGFVNELKVAVSRSIQWSLAMGALYGSIRQLKAGVQFLIDVDTSLTEIAMVTQQTREEVDHLARSYVNLARELKISTAEIMNSSVSLYRQGLNAAQVSERLITISQTAKVTGEDIGRVTDYVTAGVNALEVSAERYNDVLIKTASIAGTTYGELGEAISKNASSFKNANVGLEKVVSYMGAIIERTRESATSVGTFGKTLVARFQRINQETGETNKNLNKIQGAIESVGIDFLDAAGQIRPVSDILDELNGIWTKLDGNTQKYIATQAAGLRQGNRFLALMDGYERSLEIYDEALNASGTTQEQYNKYLESTQALIDELKVTWENLYLSVINSDWVKDFYNILIELVKTLQIVIGDLKTIIPLVGLFVGAFKAVTLINALDALTKGMAELGKHAFTLEEDMESVVTVLAKMKDKNVQGAKSLDTLIAKLSALTAPLIIIASIGALIVGSYIKAEKAAKRFEEGQAELQETLASGSIPELKETKSEVVSLAEKYEELRNKLDDAKEGDPDLNSQTNEAYELQKELDVVTGKLNDLGIKENQIDAIISTLTNTIENKTEALEEEKKEVERLNGIYEDHLTKIANYDKAQLESHLQLLQNKRDEVEALKSATTAWIKYQNAKHRTSVEPPEMPKFSDFVLYEDPQKTFKNAQFYFRQELEQFNKAGNIPDVRFARMQEKIRDLGLDKDISDIDAQIKAVEERLSGFSYDPGPDTDGDGDGDDGETIEDKWKKRTDSIIKELEREKKNRENIWKQISDAYDDTIEGYQEELKLMEEKNEKLEEEEERRKKIQALREAEMELNNLLKERRFQRLQGGEWVNVADPRKVKEAQDKVADLRDEYREWDEQKEREKEEKELQDKIDAEQKKKEAAEERYRDIQAIADDVLNNIKNIDAETLGERELMLQSYVNFYEEQMKKMEDLAGDFMPETDYQSPSLEEFQDGDIKYKKIGDDIYKNIGEGWYKTAKEDRKYIPEEIGGGFKGAEESTSTTPSIVSRYVEAGITYTLDSLGQITKGDRSITDPDSMKYIPSVVGGTREGSKTAQEIMNYNIKNLEVIANNPEEFGEALELAARMNK